MHYTWLNVHGQDEDPDACITKICHLGPYMLELTEDGWDDDTLIMAFNVYRWNDLTKEWDDIDTNLKPKEYNRKTSHTILEDWYACNVLIEDHLG